MGDDNKTAIAEKVFDFGDLQRRRMIDIDLNPLLEPEDLFSIKKVSHLSCVVQETWYY